MFQEPLTAVMAMLFLYFAGMLVMFVFVIRSLASQGDARREAFRKQQLMLGDLERQLIDMKVMLRRLMPEHEERVETGMEQDQGLPIFKPEDPLESMLEAALSTKAESAPIRESKSEAPRQEARPGDQAAKGFSLPVIEAKQPQKDEAAKGASSADTGLPDFFSDSDKPRSEKLPLGAHMFPPHESLGKSGGAQTLSGHGLAGNAHPSDKSRKPVSFVSLDAPGKNEASEQVALKGLPVSDKNASLSKGVADGDDFPLQVFSIGKNPKLQEQPDSSSGAPLTPPFSAKVETPPLSKSMENIRRVFSGESVQENEDPAPQTVQKPRLRVSGPSSDFGHGPGGASTVAKGAPVPSAKKSQSETPLPGVGGALFAARGAHFSGGESGKPVGAADDGESLKHIFEEGLKADVSMNLFDLEAEKEERKQDENGGERTISAEAQVTAPYQLGLEDPVPQGFTVVHSSRVEETLLVEQKLPIESPVSLAEEATPGGISVEPQVQEPKVLSRRIGKYSFEVSSLNAPLTAPVPAVENSAADAGMASIPSVEGPHADTVETGTSTLEEISVAVVKAEQVDSIPDDPGEAAATYSHLEREQTAFKPRALHPIDRKILSKRKLPGKKGRHPASF